MSEKKEIIEKLEGELNYLESIIKEKIGNMIATNNAHNLLKELEEALSLAKEEDNKIRGVAIKYYNSKIDLLEKQISDLEEKLKDTEKSLANAVNNVFYNIEKKKVTNP